MKQGLGKESIWKEDECKTSVAGGMKDFDFLEENILMQNQDVRGYTKNKLLKEKTGGLSQGGVP